MIRFAASRVFRTLATLFAVIFITFLLTRLAGDPVKLMLPPEASEAQVEQMRANLGLDQPVLVQFFYYIGGLLRLDFGDSIRQGSPALEVVLERLPFSIELAVVSFILGLALAILFAVAGEIGGGKLRDAFVWISTARQAVPPYLFGILLILIFSVWLQVFPSIGRGGFKSYILPVLTIATFEVAVYLRLINASFERSRREDFVQTAKAKGLSKTQVVLKHQLPNALVPLITVAGINLGVLLGGLVVLETVFNWPGIGRLVVEAVGQRDYPVVQAGVIVIATIFIAINVVVDLLYSVVDPRVRTKR